MSDSLPSSNSSETKPTVPVEGTQAAAPVVPDVAPIVPHPVPAAPSAFSTFTFADPTFTAYDQPGDPFYLAPADRDAMIDKIAAHVDSWGLHTPAIFALSLGMPLSFLAGQALTLFGSAFLMPFFGRQRVENWQNFLNNRKNVELLLHRLEHDAETENQRRAAAKTATKPASNPTPAPPPHQTPASVP